MLLDKRNDLVSKLVFDTIRLVLKFMEATLSQGIREIGLRKGIETYSEKGDFLLRRGNFVMESL
jgi:hypothetical protein